MRTAFKAVLILACVALLSPAAPAMAKTKTQAPPGNSGVEEYLEVVPGGGGNRPSGSLKRSKRALSPKARGALRSYGRDGQAASNLASVTADDSSPRGGKGGKGGRAGQAAALGAAARTAGESDSGDDGGVIGALKRVWSQLGGDGLGAGLPILLFATLAGAVLLTLRRRQRSSES